MNNFFNSWAMYFYKFLHNSKKKMYKMILLKYYAHKYIENVVI